MSQDVDIVFAGTSIPDALAAEGVEFAVMDTEGEGLIGSENQSADRPGTDGHRLVDSNLPARTIVVHYSLQVASEASHDALTDRLAIERLLNGLLHRPGLSRLEFSHMDGYFMARLSGLPKSTRYAHMFQGAIEFYAPQPFLYGPEHTTEPNGGVLTVETNHYVEPVILWTTDQQVGAAWIEVDGERLTIETQISADQQIHIDCARKEVRLGGVLNVENIGLPGEKFPEVWNGSTVTSSPGGDMSFSYQERHI